MMLSVSRMLDSWPRWPRSISRPSPRCSARARSLSCPHSHRPTARRSTGCWRTTMPEDDTFGDDDFGFDDDVAPLAPSPSDMVDSMALAMGLDPNELARPTQNQIANQTP